MQRKKETETKMETENEEKIIMNSSILFLMAPMQGKKATWSRQQGPTRPRRRWT